MTEKDPVDLARVDLMAHVSHARTFASGQLVARAKERAQPVTQSDGGAGRLVECRGGG